MSEASQPSSCHSRPSHLPGKKKKKKKHLAVIADISGTRYDIVRQMVEQSGFIASKLENSKSFLIWCDSCVCAEKITELKPHQKINHFPGMSEVCRKDSLARNMAKMAKVYSEFYDFVPKTWILPNENSLFLNYVWELKKKKKIKTFISKPPNSAMGQGISLFRNPDKIPLFESMIVQEYIEKPFLLDGYKFDLRLYVLLTSCDPLRVFMYNDGLVRLSTEKYCLPSDENLDVLYMHLTNYSVNKYSENYERGSSVCTGTKRSINYLNEYLRKSDKDVNLLWRNITDIIIKTLIVAEPHILSAYRMCRPAQVPGTDSVCFEVLGFDILLDRKLKPWLLEVNRSPSFKTDEVIDYEIKSGVIIDALQLLNISAKGKEKIMKAEKSEARLRLLRPIKRNTMETGDFKRLKERQRKKEELREILLRIRYDATREEYEKKHCGRYLRIFPPDDKFRVDKYMKLLEGSLTLFIMRRFTDLQKEVGRICHKKYREEDILTMLEEFESDTETNNNINEVNKSKSLETGLPINTLTAEYWRSDDESNSSSPSTASSNSDGYSSRDFFDYSSVSPTEMIPVRVKEQYSYQSNTDDEVNGCCSSQQRNSSSQVERSSHNSRMFSSFPNMCPDVDSHESDEVTRKALDAMHFSEKKHSRVKWSNMEELTRLTHEALTNLTIKLPGKIRLNSKKNMQQLMDDWRSYKHKVASYWLLKLDFSRRKKLIEIVKNDTQQIMQTIWTEMDVDNLHLFNIFDRIFKYMLSNHGQGLWTSFSSSSSWESVIKLDSLSKLEKDCCCRIVQLCQEGALLMYTAQLDEKKTTNFPKCEGTSIQKN